jgi:hypothetical protein
MKLKQIVLVIGLAFGAGAANADYTYLGSFTTNGSVAFADGSTAFISAPAWGTNPPVYSGLDAAALLFGGSSSSYIISTVNSASNPNGMAWYDGWGDHAGHEYAADYKLDLSGLGYNGCSVAGIPCTHSAYSAYITDGFSGTNYVYAVPEPETYALMLAGLGLMGVIARRRKSK